MKTSIIASTVVAFAAYVAADDSCFMTLGQYTTGGAYCVAPLPAFADQNGCTNSAQQCNNEYQDCQTQTQSVSACLPLLVKCQVITKFCSSRCAVDNYGNTPDGCNLDTAIAWNGISTPISSAVVMTPVTTATPVIVQTTPAVYKSTPVAYAPVALVTPDVPCGQCYTDGSNYNRGLGTQKFPSYGTLMTPKTCMSLCAGYKYSAVEFGSECWCGNSLLNNAAPASGCSNTCQGDKSQTCGGSWLMNIYQSGCAAPSSTPVAYVAPVKSTPVAYVAPVKSTPAAVYTAPVVGYNTPAKTVASPVVKNTPTVGICKVPAAYATPVGGYHAPIVACNDLSDYTSSPWKLYTTHATANAPTYGSSSTTQACTDSCTFQYNSCVKDYASTLSTYSSYSSYKMRRGSAHQKRTWWLWGAPAASSNTYATTKDTYSTAMAKCYAQKVACNAANSYIVVNGKCGANGVFTASGATTYSSGSSSYGGNSYGSCSGSACYSSTSSYSGSSTDNDNYY